MFNIVGRQMIVMAIMLFCGGTLYKTKLISQEGSKTLTTLLVYFINPVALIRSFCRERTVEGMKTFALCFVLCGFLQIFGILVSHLVYKKKPLEEFAASYPNAGFFGIPVIQAVLGPKAVFYMAPLVFFAGTIQHSYGVSLLLGSKKSFDIKRFFLAPNTIGLLGGMLIFFSGLGTKIPSVVSQSIDIIANMNTFFAMATLGIFLVQADLSQLYKNIDIYIISTLRTLIIPLISAVLFRFIPVDNVVRMAILLAWAGPVGANVANYSQLYNKDYSKASIYVAVSTIFCLLTLPLFAIIIDHII